MACQVKPDEATLVPERRAELTTEGGLDVVSHEAAVGRIIGRLQGAGIEVSLFIDPDRRQIARGAGARSSRGTSLEHANRLEEAKPPGLVAQPSD